MAHSSLEPVIRKSNPHLNRKGIRQFLKSTRKDRISQFVSSYEKTEEGAMVERERIIDETFRVICFASSEAEPCDEILMWSHYSASHKGVKIGFEFPKSRIFSISPIAYEQKRVVVDMAVITIDPASQKGAIAQSIRTKNKAWAYEKEYRLFIDPGDCVTETGADGQTIQFISIQRDWVKRVDFGTRYPSRERASFLNLVKTKYPQTECYQAKYHKTDYSLSYEKLS